MKKQSAASFAAEASKPTPFKTKTLVRYVGFDVIEGHRRLNFSVKPFRSNPMAVTVDIPDPAFTGRFKVSIQDAVQIAYDTLARLSNTDGGLQVREMSLTDEDIAQYRRLHGIEPKRTNDSILDRWRRSGFAA